MHTLYVIICKHQPCAHKLRLDGCSLISYILKEPIYFTQDSLCMWSKLILLSKPKALVVAI